MAGRRASRDAITREQWAAVIAASERVDAHREDEIRPARRGREPISRRRIVDAALGVIAAIGYDRLTMRTVADALDTGPASLYAHVRNKAQLGDLLVGELCSWIDLPEPDPARWQEQFRDVCGQLRDQLLQYPGIAQAALAVVPADLTVLRVGEALLAFLLAGGVPAQDAAWTCDAAFLYITAYCLEASVAGRQGEDVHGEVVDRAEIEERLKMLPVEQFPNTVAFARELTAGEGHDRFDHTLRLMMRGLSSRCLASRQRRPKTIDRTRGPATVRKIAAATGRTATTLNRTASR
jgi:AcrR family transcriptional regulator